MNFLIKYEIIVIPLPFFKGNKKGKELKREELSDQRNLLSQTSESLVFSIFLNFYIFGWSKAYFWSKLCGFGKVNERMNFFDIFEKYQILRSYSVYRHCFCLEGRCNISRDLPSTHLNQFLNFQKKNNRIIISLLFPETASELVVEKLENLKFLKLIAY